jgi:diguanylate cyclase (GGDEF)-like protein/PAS domain S-box-containing protein
MPHTLAPDPKQNRILAALSTNDFARLQDDLELVSLKVGQVLYDAGDSVGYVYFPLTCIVSLVFTTQKGSSAELAITGNEGLVGIPLVLGGDTTTHRVIVQNAGEAYRLKVEVIRWELDQGGDLQHLALRYTQALMTQMAQSVVCNRHHAVDQQLCRFLLLSLDRLPDNQIHLTQELIGSMLGVRREAVTEAAGKLQTAGLIQYSRGLIKVVDRPGLEARACECYAVVKAEYDRLFQLTGTARSRDYARPNPESVRKRAEARWKQAPPEAPKTPWDNTQLVHELQVHQIELEMHNEALRHAFEEVDALRDRYADIYDFAPVGYFTLDPQGVIVDLNLTGAILLGVKGSQKGRHQFASSVAPADRATFTSFLATVLHASQKIVCEITLAATNQRPEATVKIEAIPNEEENECRMVVIDVTAEREAQKALHAREQYQRALLDNFPFIVWLKDAESRLVAVNKPFAEHFGWPSAQSLEGKTDFDIVDKAQAESFVAADQAVLLSGVQRSTEERREINGRQRWFEIYKSPVVLADQPIGTVGFARDITLRHNTRQALESSEQRYRGFIEELPLSVAVIQDDVLQYINPKSSELIGYSSEECFGKSFLPMVFEGDRPRVINALEVFSRGEPLPKNYEIRLIKKNGQVIDCRLHVSTVAWAGRNAALATFEDVTAQNAMAAELQNLARIDLLTELSSEAHFQTHLELAQARLLRSAERPHSIVMIRLDHFVTINTVLGRLASDAVLRLFSALLRDELRDVDIAARVEGEKFAVLLPETDQSEAEHFAERLRQKVADTSINARNQLLPITVSIGIAEIYVSDNDARQCLRRANQALDQAKAAGGNQIAIAAALNTAQAAPQITNQGAPDNAERRKQDPAQAPGASEG